MSAYSGLTVAIIGFGSIGRRHAENLRALGVDRLVIVRRGEHANPAFAAAAAAHVVTNLQAAIEVQPDLAIVTNPTSLHVQTARALVEAGVPVLIEKPVGHRLDEAQALANIVNDRSAFCSMAYCMRYHPAYALARRAMHEGRIGRVLYARAWFESFLPGWHPWEDYRTSYAARRELGGGVLPTLDHDIDYFNWCFGSPEATHGWSLNTQSLDIDVDDWATLVVRYAGGIAATLSMSFSRQDRRRGFEIVGQEGTLRFSMEQGQLLLCRGETNEVLWNGRGYDLNQMYADMLADVLTALVHQPRLPPPAPLAAGLAALAMMNQVRSLADA
jgi:predicted dehydrogenase